ncbi:Major facilitator superfamily domain, general substrate transporter [Metarhizium album ARSEF 1941]|uniref:Major facilitator superfamily domain, general substrate transporter n=1 Tax=Metarhizium album (strain ARSEF 1941) TaxID=1081103 RepID=A0A0B2WGM8_METAS|nr:Major facilitator superfamily domain, general substrate transporter [Metarhizium album ARSEF 1941]KHN95156.1 Major facilitator superfamily domain, general substrate transporter [Metarhizium album ARSEF 1941]
MASLRERNAQDREAVSEAAKSPPTPGQLDTADAEPSRTTSPPAPRLGRDVGEDSPLLSSNDSDPGDAARPNPASHHLDGMQETKGLWYMVMLTISMGGLQLAWAVELSNGSPYLLSLGLSKSLMALVWIAGPLTGTLVVPYVGIISDNCRMPWGKRRPFMVGGTIATVAGLMFLAWTREIVGGILGLFGADSKSEGVKVVTIAAAVIGVYVLDIAINTVQAAIRAFFVDCAPAHQQEEANAMASRATGIGNIMGFVAGYVNLPTYLWFLGNSQFKILCAVASIGLAITIALSTASIRERNPRTDGSPIKKTPNFVTFFFNIFKSIKRLPPQTKRVCQVQFFAWVGFFPLLFYTSSYIGEIYVQPYLEENPNMTPEELEALYEQATRIGTFALLINAIVSLLTNIFLPFFIAPTFDSHPVSVNTHTGQPVATKTTALPRRSYLDYLRLPGFTLKRAWLGSLVLFAVSMFCTVLVRSVAGATVLIGLAGITWAMALWAPWAIISGEISRRDTIARVRQLQNMAPGQSSSRGAPSPSGSSQGTVDAELPGQGEEVDQAGVILGIHNMAIAVPQVVATVGSSVVFKFLQKPRGTPGDQSFAIVMALGGLFVLGSCIFAMRIKDDADATEEALHDEARGALLADEATGN